MTSLASALVAPVELVLDAMRSQLGPPFDDGAVHDFLSDRLLDRDWRDAAKWFCSELAPGAIERAGFFPFKPLIPKNRVSPADLSLLLNPSIEAHAFWPPMRG
jgi:hypothetical protein